MIRVRTCFAAEGISIDRESNRVSAFGIAERLDATEFPLLIPKLHFFCLWERDLTDPAQVRAAFVAELEGRHLTSTSIDIDFEQVRRSRCVVRMDNLPIESAGALLLRLSIPGHAVADWRIDVGDSKPAAAASEGGVNYQSMNVVISTGSVIVRR